MCPEVEDQEQLNGQLLEVEVSSLSDTVGDMKARAACSGTRAMQQGGFITARDLLMSAGVPSMLQQCTFFFSASVMRPEH
jgi:hypothetical protein